MKYLVIALAKLNRAKESNLTFGEVHLLECEVDVLANVVRFHAMRQAFRLLGMRGAQ